MKEIPVHFYSDGARISGRLYIPSETDAPSAGVVVCQGFGSTKEINLPEIAKYLAGEGITALIFDYRGFGESEGTRWRLVPSEQVADIHAAVTFLGARDEVDDTRLGLIGVSFGGSNAIEAAATDKRIKAVVAAVAFGDGARWMRSMRRFWEYKAFLHRLTEDRVRRVQTGTSLEVDPDEIVIRDPEAAEWRDEIVKNFPERRFRLMLETGEYILGFCPEHYISMIAPRAVMLVGASDDSLVDPEETRLLYSAAKEPKKIMMLEGIEHHAIYVGNPFEQWMREATDFLSEHISN